MNKISMYTLKALRRLYQKFFDDGHLQSSCETDPDRASEMIYKLLSSGEPCMIARYGANELAMVINYLAICCERHSAIKFITMRGGMVVG